MFQLRSPTRRQVSRVLVLALAGVAVGPLGAEAGIGSERADRIVVLKAERRLVLLRGNSFPAIFPIALGPRPVGPKFRRGDGRTPEGLYSVDRINSHSRYHRALHISYPNAEDIQRARAAGASPGGDIEIHGMPNGYGNFDPVAFFRDWTDGCIAVGNRAIEEICASASIGTPVEIRA